MIKILLVDDEYHVITHITNLLQQIDFCEINIRQTTSGTEALQLICSSHIDIAFLDINMPKINGLQLADQLHRQWPNCQIIFLTAYEIFDYIYEANQYRGAIYLLKTESDKKILSVASSCCQQILDKRNEETYFSNIQRKEKLLLLLQEQQLLQAILHGNLMDHFDEFVQKTTLEIPFSFDQNIYLMLMHVRQSPNSLCDTSFYLEKMEELIGNLFLFSFLETDNRMILWVFQEKDHSNNEICYFDYLKDSIDSFLDICTEIKHQTLSLFLYREMIPWKQLSRTYQFLYDSYFKDSALLSCSSSAARTVEKEQLYSALTNGSSSAAALDLLSNAMSLDLSSRLASMKQALYQGNQDLFFTEFLYCMQYCTSIKSMHNIKAIKAYFSVVLIYLDYIEHYKLEPQIAMEIALYPLYYMNDFSDWKDAFSYLKKLGKIIFRISLETNNDKTQRLISIIQTYIQEHLSDDLNLSVIAKHVNYNDSHISRLFKRYTGSNLSEYITSCRIEYAKKLLSQTEDTIQTISQKTGFHTSQYFSSTFRKNTGMSPNEYRNKR